VIVVPTGVLCLPHWVVTVPHETRVVGFDVLSVPDRVPVPGKLAATSANADHVPDKDPEPDRLATMSLMAAAVRSPDREPEPDKLTPRTSARRRRPA